MNERKPSKNLDARRLKRNKDSRDWKKAHKTKVRAWSKAWALEQAGNKEAADKLRSAVRGEKGNDRGSKEEGTSVHVNSKTAIERAKAYFNEIFSSVKDLRLEEIERSSDNTNWLVTFSLARPDLTILGAPVTNPHRDYKTVSIDAKTGEPVAIKMRVMAQ